MIAVKTIILPKDSANKDPQLGKEFIKFVVEQKRFAEYVKGANGRWFPASRTWRAIRSSPRASGQGRAVDPHLPTVTKIYTERPTRVFDHWKNRPCPRSTPRTSGQGDGRTNVDKWTPEKAADEAIARIKTIVAQWR